MTIPKIKDELRRLGVGGYSGKNKPELLEMLDRAYQKFGTPGRQAISPTLPLRMHLRGRLYHLLVSQFHRHPLGCLYHLLSEGITSTSSYRDS